MVCQDSCFYRDGIQMNDEGNGHTRRLLASKRLWLFIIVFGLLSYFVGEPLCTLWTESRRFSEAQDVAGKMPYAQKLYMYGTRHHHRLHRNFILTKRREGGPRDQAACAIILWAEGDDRETEAVIAYLADEAVVDDDSLGEICQSWLHDRLGLPFDEARKWASEWAARGRPVEELRALIEKAKTSEPAAPRVR